MMLRLTLLALSCGVLGPTGFFVGFFSMPLSNMPESHLYECGKCKNQDEFTCRWIGMDEECHQWSEGGEESPDPRCSDPHTPYADGYVGNGTCWEEHPGTCGNPGCASEQEEELAGAVAQRDLEGVLAFMKTYPQVWVELNPYRSALRFLVDRGDDDADSVVWHLGLESVSYSFWASALKRSIDSDEAPAPESVPFMSPGSASGDRFSFVALAQDQGTPVIGEAAQVVPIDLELEVTLKSAGDSSAVNKHFSLAVDGEGRFLVSSPFAAGSVSLYSPGGELLARYPGGQPGLVRKEGPGPRLFVRRMQPFRDAVFAFDPALGTVSKLPGSTGIVPAIPLPGAFYDGDFLSDGSLFISSHIRTPERAGMPLHVVSKTGEVVRSFGEDPAGFRAGQNLNRAVDVSGDTLWCAHVADYVIEAWSRGGELLLTRRRDPDWFVPAEKPRLKDDPSPRPGVLDIRVTADNRLQVLLEIPDPKWVEGIEQRPGSPGYARTDWHKYVDTVLEIIDLAEFKVISRSRFDDRIEKIVDDNRVASYHEGTGIKIWRTVPLGRTMSSH